MRSLKNWILILTFIIITGCSNQINNDTIDVIYTGFGAQETVSGSFHMIQVGDDSYVVDTGSFYGEGDNYPLPNEVDLDKIDAIFITHAHADHIGRLPLLLYEGYTGPIYMTPVTYDIAKISLLSNIRYMDFGEERFYYSKNNKSNSKPVYLDRFSYGDFEVQKHNRIYLNLKREDLDENGYYLSPDTIKYLEEELLEKLNNQVEFVNYDEALPIKDNITVEFIYTSHLPGSAMIKFEIEDKKILFTGDIGSERSPFLQDNRVISESIDFIFTEGTYGVETLEDENRIVKYQEDRLTFRKLLGEQLDNNKRIIIPAFVIDRTQQVLYEIKVGMEDGIIPSETNVKAYSPTSEKITNLYSYYSHHKEGYSDYFSEVMFSDLFKIENLIYNPRQPDNNLYDLTIEYGEIALMSSGMLSSAFSLEAVKNYIEDENTVFVLVGYQDPDEVGGRLRGGEKEIIIDGISYEVKAPIFNTPAFSGHGDINQIYSVIEQTDPTKIFLVHLNSYDSELLKAEYEDLFPEAEILVPKYKEDYFLFSY